MSAILKQNPEFYADISSPVEALTGCSIDIITGAEINLTVTENQRKNLLYGIFGGYYQHIEISEFLILQEVGQKKTNY